MKMKIITIMLILSLGFNVGVLFFFGNHFLMKKSFSGKRHFQEDHWLKDTMRRECALTDEQAQKLEKEREGFEASIRPLKKELQQKRKELFAAVAGELPEVKTDQLIQDLTRLQIQMEKSVIAHMGEVKKSLTPEQQKKFLEMIEKGPMRMPFGFRKDRGSGPGKG